MNHYEPRRSFVAVHELACGTERRSFGLGFTPGIGSTADLPSVDRMSGMGANDPTETLAAKFAVMPASSVLPP